MLTMKPACEECNAPLRADGVAFICSYECTFCEACAIKMQHICPNCEGLLVARPPRVLDPAQVIAQRSRGFV